MSTLKNPYFTNISEFQHTMYNNFTPTPQMLKIHEN